MSAIVEIWLNSDNRNVGAPAATMRLASALEAKQNIAVRRIHLSKGIKTPIDSDVTFAIGSHFTHPLTQRASRGLFWVHNANHLSAERAQGVESRSPGWVTAGCSQMVASGISKNAIALHPIVEVPRAKVLPLNFSKALGELEKFDEIFLCPGGDTFVKGAAQVLRWAESRPSSGFLVTEGVWGKRDNDSISAMRELPNIAFARRLDFSKTVFDSVNAVLTSSPSEGFNMTAAEATINGTPVIAGDWLSAPLTEATMGTAVFSGTDELTVEVPEAPKVKTALKKREAKELKMLISLIMNNTLTDRIEEEE